MNSYDESYYGRTGESARSVQLESNASALVTNFHPSTAFDIGCGEGFLVYHLRKLGVAAYGADGSEYALSVAPKEAQQYLYHLDLDHENFPLRNESMDVVTALEVLEHIASIDHVLSEISRVLKPGGIVFVTTPMPLANSKMGQFILGKGWRVLDSTHVNVHGRKFWVKAFNTYGFNYSGNFSQYARVVLPAYWVTKILFRFPFANRLSALLRGWYVFEKPKI